MGKSVELGALLNPTPGIDIYHDRWRHSQHITVAHDLNVYPWPWAAGELSQIVALDVLEHLDARPAVWLGECWRCLENGGTLRLRLPAWDNPVTYRDPEHARGFHEETFDYFDPDRELWRCYGRYYYPDGPWFQIVSVGRVNPDPRFGIGDLEWVLRRRGSP